MSCMVSCLQHPVFFLGMFWRAFLRRAEIWLMMRQKHFSKLQTKMEMARSALMVKEAVHITHKLYILDTVWFSWCTSKCPFILVVQVEYKHKEDVPPFSNCTQVNMHSKCGTKFKSGKDIYTHIPIYANRPQNLTKPQNTLAITNVLPLCFYPKSLFVHTHLFIYYLCQLSSAVSDKHYLNWNYLHLYFQMWTSVYITLAFLAVGLHSKCAFFICLFTIWNSSIPT